MHLLDPFRRLIERTSPVYARHLNSVRICGLQHILPSQEQLFGAVREAGFTNGLPIVIGKLYSTVRAAPPETYLPYEPTEIHYERGSFEGAFKARLKSLCERLGITVANKRKSPVIVLDDGGFVGAFLSSWFIQHDCPVVVVEQTTSGLRHAQKYACPVVSVAGSLVKREVESTLIADSIIRAVVSRPVLPIPTAVWGVAGYGAVGRALGRVLASMKLKRVLVFDRDPALRAAAADDGLEAVSDANSLVERSDLLFGCTGEDLSKGILRSAIRRGHADLLCASCGSSDSEFASWMSSSEIARLFRRPDGRVGGNGFNTVAGDFAAGRYQVLNGGFPINLNRHWKSDRVEDFILTRMLVFAGIVQALEVLSDGWTAGNRILPLHDQFETDVQQIWFDAFPGRLGEQARTRVVDLLARRSASKP